MFLHGRDLSVLVLIQTIRRLTKEKVQMASEVSSMLQNQVAKRDSAKEEAMHQNSTCGAAENVGTATKPNGITHEPIRADRPNAFSNNSSSVLSCIQTAVDIPFQIAGPSTFELPNHALVGPGRKGGVRSTVILLIEGFHRKDQNSSASSSEGCGLSVKRSSSADTGHLGNATVPCTGDGSTWNNIEGINSDKSIDSGRPSLARSSLDADREHRDSNPPVTDSNDIEDMLPNHISFLEEHKLQGLGKWLQRCRVMLHHLAGTPDRAWLLFNLIFILETVVVAIFRPQTIKLLNATHQQIEVFWAFMVRNARHSQGPNSGHDKVVKIYATTCGESVSASMCIDFDVNIDPYGIVLSSLRSASLHPKKRYLGHQLLLNPSHKKPPIPPLPGPAPGAIPSMSLQFQPMLPAQKAQPYGSGSSQQFLPLQHANVAMSQPSQIKFPQPMQQVELIEIRVKALEGVHSDYGDTHEDPKLVTSRLVVGMHSMPQGPPIPHDFQQNLSMSNNHMPGSGGPNLPLSSSYNVNADSSCSQYQTQINDHRFPSGVQPWMPKSNHNVNSATTIQKTGELASPLVVPHLLMISRPIMVANVVIFPMALLIQPINNILTIPELIFIYYYNRRTRISTWEKPGELITEMEVRSHVIEIFMGSFIQFPVLISEKRSTQFFFYEAS
ncbi:hypothetical protein FXO37_03553 [Capsicum annuum]|nr:hypothetical protein FXO37_03553 [Capsicum annuum]